MAYIFCLLFILLAGYTNKSEGKLQSLQLAYYNYSLTVYTLVHYTYMQHTFALEYYSITIYSYVMIPWNVIAVQASQTVRPIRHSLDFGLQPLNGSLPNAGCTPKNGSICNLQDGGTSVLVDNTILPLSGLDGEQWARDLYTVERGTTAFISIGFDFGTPVEVRRVELVLFNCQEWSIFASEIDIYTSTTSFLQSDPASVGVIVGSRPFDNGVNSCENVYRVCVSLRGAQAPIYYIVFPRTAGSGRVYLAETIFYTDDFVCGNDTLVTEPVTPPIATTTEGIICNTCSNYYSTVLSQILRVQI